MKCDMKWILIACALFMAGCTKPDQARSVLEGAGYKDIQMTGYDWFNCSNQDIYQDGFTATGPSGKRVSGVVCAGWFFRGSTIRLD